MNSPTVVVAVLIGLGLACHASAQTAGRGAQVPFTTYEAEAGNRTSGKVVMMTGFPAPRTVMPEFEASGRGYVQLSATGDHLEFANVRAANTIVIRHCIPDAPGGGGITVWRKRRGQDGQFGRHSKVHRCSESQRQKRMDSSAQGPK